MDMQPTNGETPDQGQEVLVFLVTCFLIIPGLAVAFTGAFGFVVWISQMIGGPPGPAG